MSLRIKRAILSITVLGLLGVALVAAQAPDRLDVLIGFDRPPGAAEENLVRAFGGVTKYTYHLVPAIEIVLNIGSSREKPYLPLSPPNARGLRLVAPRLDDAGWDPSYPTFPRWP